MRTCSQTADRWLPAGVVLAILGALASCSRGPNEGPTTYPVQGKVVTPGGRPWSGGRIAFQSVSDPAKRATGEIQSDGSFRLETYYLVAGKPRVQPGAEVGEYTVAIEEPGTTFDRGGTPSIPPHLLRQKYRVEAKENSFLLETGKPARP